MATFTVMIPIAGALHIEVEAQNADEAEQKAWDAYDAVGGEAGEVEWNAFERLVNGNVLYAPTNHVEVVKHREGE